MSGSANGARNKSANAGKVLAGGVPHSNAGGTVPAAGAAPNPATGGGAAAGSAAGAAAPGTVSGGQVAVNNQYAGRLGNSDLVADSTTTPGSDGGRFATEVFGTVVVLAGVAMLALSIRRRRAGTRY